MIGIGAVSWSAKKQRVTALSTLEAEYMVMSEAAREAMWMIKLLRELGANVKFIKMFADNQGAIALTKNPVFHNRSKHIDVQYHFMREKVADGMLQIKFIPSGDMIVDALTKGLPPVEHGGHCEGLGLMLYRNKRGGVLTE